MASLAVMPVLAALAVMPWLPATARATEPPPMAAGPSASMVMPAAGEQPPCTLVVGHGRNLDLQDAEANSAWNQLNNRFNAQVAGRLQAAGERVVRLPLPVEARDLAANARQMLERAQDAGCDRLLETTIFADDAAQLLVVRLRAYPILTVRNLAGPGALRSIGPPSFTSQRDRRLVLRSLEQLAPDVLARELLDDYLRQRP